MILQNYALLFRPNCCPPLVHLWLPWLLHLNTPFPWCNLCMLVFLLFSLIVRRWWRWTYFASVTVFKIHWKALGYGWVWVMKLWWRMAGLWSEILKGVWTTWAVYFNIHDLTPYNDNRQWHLLQLFHFISEKDEGTLISNSFPNLSTTMNQSWSTTTV